MSAVHRMIGACAGEDWLPRLKADAETAPLRRSRLCLHPDDSASVHEMLIAFRRDSLVPIHRHFGKSESFHMVEGEVMVILFDDDGGIESKTRLGPVGSGLPFLHRIERPVWHTVVPLTETAVLHEVTTGPFTPADKDFPAWAPEGGPELAAFLAKIVEAP